MELSDPEEGPDHRPCSGLNQWSNSPTPTNPATSLTPLPSPFVLTPTTVTAAASVSKADGSSASPVLIHGCRSHSSPPTLTIGPEDDVITESDRTGKVGADGAGQEPSCHDHGPRTATSLDPGPPSPSSDNSPMVNDLETAAPPPPPPPPPPPLPLFSPSKAASSSTPMKMDSPQPSAGPGIHRGSLSDELPQMTDDSKTAAGTDATSSLPSGSPHEATGQGIVRAYSSMPGSCSFPGGPATPWQLEGAHHRRRHQTALCSSFGSLGNQLQHEGGTAISCDDSNLTGDEAALAAVDLSEDGDLCGASWHLPSGLIGTPQPSPPSQSRRLMPPPCWDRTQPLQPGSDGISSRCHTAAMTNLQQRLNFDSDEIVEHKSEAPGSRPHGTVIVTPVPATAASKAGKSPLCGDGSRGDMTAQTAAIPMTRMNSSPYPSSKAFPSATSLMTTAKSFWEGGWSSPASSLAPLSGSACRSLSSQWPAPGAAIVNDDWVVQQQQPRHHRHNLLPEAAAEARHQGLGRLEQHVHPLSGDCSHVNTIKEAASLELASAGSSPETESVAALAARAQSSCSGGSMGPLMSMPTMVMPGSSGTPLCSSTGGNSCLEGTSSTQFSFTSNFSSAFAVDNPGVCISQPQQSAHLLQHGYIPQQQQQQEQQSSLALAMLPPPPPPPLQHEQQQHLLPDAVHHQATQSAHLPMFNGDDYYSRGSHQTLLPGILPSQGQQFQMPLMMPGYQQQHQISAAAHQLVSAPQWPSQMPRSHGGDSSRARIHSQVYSNSFSAYQQQPNSFSSSISLGAMASPAPLLTAANAPGSALPHQYIGHHQHQATDMLPQQTNRQFPQLHHQMQHPPASIHRGSKSYSLGKAAPAASAMSNQQQHGCDQLTATMPASAAFTATCATTASQPPSSMYLKPIANKVDVRKWMASNLP